MRNVAIAALSFALTPSAEIQLLPAGEFRATDGRPKDVKAWKMDADIAQRLIAAAASRVNPYVIDYEHQSLLSTNNGQPAPAAGWYKSLQWREGVGLFATDVTWTDRAKAMIAAGEYKFLSPVFAYDKRTGEVTQLNCAGITNTTGLDGMDAIAARFDLTHPQESSMNEMLKKLLAALGLQETATEEQALAALTALQAKVTETETEVAALKAQAPDPAKYVPVQTMQALQGEVAALTARLNTKELDDLVDVALSAGKLLGAQEAWARELGGKDLPALKAYLDTAQPIAALKGTQTGGRTPPGGASDETLEARSKREWEASAALRDEFGEQARYLGYLKAEADGRIKIYQSKEA